MRFYSPQHRFYASIDLHAWTLHLCVLAADGTVAFDRNLPARPDALLRALAPFRDGLVGGVACMFAWYWVADLGQQEHIAFAIDFRAARARLPLAAVLDLMGCVPQRRLGDQVRGPCPVHGSRRPQSRSFAAHRERGVWHCFRCGAGGNVLDLWAAVTRQPLHAAVLDWCRRLGREVPWLPRAVPAPRREETTMPDP